MQHDVYVNPEPGTRPYFPLIAVLQADIAEGRNRIVAPMAPRAAMPRARGRLLPIVELNGQLFVVAVQSMVSVPPRALRQPVGSIREYRDDITRALDWLFTGV